MVRRGNPQHPIVRALKGFWDNGFESVGKFYSLYRGVVIDNVDPEQIGRLKLLIPQISPFQAYEYWAFPRNVPSSEKFGVQMIPPISSMVWVEFEGGEPEIQVLSHGHFGKGDIPKEDEDLGDPNCYWFITPKGHKVKINDTKNYIEIKSSLGDIIHVNEKAISLITKRQISLGTKDKSNEPAVLGTKLSDLLKDLNKIVGDLHGALLKDTAALTAAKLVNTVKVLPTLTLIVKTLQERLDKILSNKVTLD